MSSIIVVVWQVCGGGPSVCLWHLRSMSPTSVFQIPNVAVNVAMFHDDTVMWCMSLKFYCTFVVEVCRQNMALLSGNAGLCHSGKCLELLVSILILAVMESRLFFRDRDRGVPRPSRDRESETLSENFE